MSLLTESLRTMTVKSLPGKVCPQHPAARLDGGPVWFHCPQGHSVVAADLDHEHRGGAS